MESYRGRRWKFTDCHSGVFIIPPNLLLVHHRSSCMWPCRGLMSSRTFLWSLIMLRPSLLSLTDSGGNQVRRCETVKPRVESGGRFDSELLPATWRNWPPSDCAAKLNIKDVLIFFFPDNFAFFLKIYFQR